MALLPLLLLLLLLTLLLLVMVLMLIMLFFLTQDVAEKRLPIMLCANKVDLREEASASGRRCVSVDEGERMARDHSAIFVETSAKSGANVVDALVQLARDMCSSEDVEIQTSHFKIKEDHEKKKTCC